MILRSFQFNDSMTLSHHQVIILEWDLSEEGGTEEHEGTGRFTEGKRWPPGGYRGSWRSNVTPEGDGEVVACSCCTETARRA